MPTDHYRMTIQAKPLASLGEKHHSGTDQVLLGIARPLGHLRKPKTVFNATADIPKPIKTDSDDKFPSVTGVGIYDSDDDMSSKGSTVSGDTSRTKTTRRGSLPSVGMTKAQLFENRYKLAAARSQPDTTKPANMYSKRVVYLPMFRINLQTYIGETEDNKTVETTRQSLKKILDKSRSKMKSPDKIASKLRDYFKEQEMESIKKLETERENEFSRKEMLRVHIPKTPFPSDQNSIRIPTHVVYDGRIHGNKPSVETLDLTSVTDDDGCSIISTKTSKTKLSDQETQKQKPQFSQLMYGHETDRETQNNNVSYADIRRMRQKGRLKILQKRDGSAKTSRSTNDQQDAKDWISIQSKPVLKYTTPQSVKPRLDPICVPSQGCAECPMCKASKYKTTEPTAVPPNSPTLKHTAVDDECREPHHHHDISEGESYTEDSQEIQTYEHLNRNISAGKKPTGKPSEVRVKKNKNYILPVSKVTVRMSKYKAGHLKDAKLTNSFSSSTGSINEL